MAMSMCLSNFTRSILQNTNCAVAGLQQIRNKWTKALTRRDMKRRKMAKDHSVERLRLLCLKKNNILPPEILEDAHKLFDERIPRQTALVQLTNRCVLTSRPRGVLVRWRISRFIFRHEIDYNKMSGMQRAMW